MTAPKWVCGGAGHWSKEGVGYASFELTSFSWEKQPRPWRARPWDPHAPGKSFRRLADAKAWLDSVAAKGRGR